ncbi:alpha/beta hydrolase family protein [Tsukamurella tyrosinosolvens]|uniref:alpha/beta hydrolase family protein n=1 Tax=Tsukamurella tyrosinosolvens TaxID=57704 RepID=UPI000795CE34|nr:hypothetical protein [Tsukamurella tyrosinosolvens]KXP06024.1 hypothetical protein AXK59_11115 [Tsukamurella tyrosinosolvens]KZL95856.1 hypothetical protein AXX05_22205 [Tsukamurella tyrosinosolvens]
MRARWISTIAAAMALGVVAGCSSPASPPATSSAAPLAWVDDEVTFDSGGLTIHGTLHRPASGAPVPAAVIIAGSGPTDRDGNSRLLPGTVNTLKSVAAMLADAGVASLRYDKLGSGQTGAGRYATDPGALGADVFIGEARDALTYLASRPSVDRNRLSAYGHSEGALFALQLAASRSGPTVRSVGLLEPLSRRYLDIVSRQVTDQVTAAVKAGSMSRADGDALLATLSSAITQVRTSGTVPGDLPPALGSVLNPGTARFLQEMDRIDPQELARSLPARYPVLLTCSDADIQVSCTDVDHLAAGLTAADPTFVRLSGVSHVLKEDPSRDPSKYTAPLPFSARAGTAITAFAGRH